MKQWQRNAIRHSIIYAFDMTIAILGWTFGFGLHVKSWAALLGLLFFSRLIVHTLSTAWVRADALRCEHTSRTGFKRTNGTMVEYCDECGKVTGYAANPRANEGGDAK